MNIDRSESFLAHALTASTTAAVLFVAVHGALTGTHGELVAQTPKAGAIQAKQAPASPAPTTLAHLAAVKRTKG